MKNILFTIALCVNWSASAIFSPDLTDLVSAIIHFSPVYLGEEAKIREELQNKTDKEKTKLKNDILTKIKSADSQCHFIEKISNLALIECNKIKKAFPDQTQKLDNLEKEVRQHLSNTSDENYIEIYELINRNILELIAIKAKKLNQMRVEQESKIAQIHDEILQEVLSLFNKVFLSNLPDLNAILSIDFNQPWNYFIKYNLIEQLLDIQQRISKIEEEDRIRDETLKNAIQKLKDEQKKIQTLEDKLKRQKCEDKKRIMDLSQRLQNVTNTIKTQSDMLKETERHLEEQNKETERHLEEQNKQTASIIQIENELSKKVEKTTEMQNKIKQLEQQLQEQRQQKLAAQSKNQKLTEQVKDQQDIITSLRTRTELQKKELREKNQNITLLQEELNETTRQLQEKKRTEEELNGKVQSQQKRIEALNDSIEALNDSIEALNNLIQKKDEEIDEIIIFHEEQKKQKYKNEIIQKKSEIDKIIDQLNAQLIKLKTNTFSNSLNRIYTSIELMSFNQTTQLEFLSNLELSNSELSNNNIVYNIICGQQLICSLFNQVKEMQDTIDQKLGIIEKSFTNTVIIISNAASH